LEFIIVIDIIIVIIMRSID